MKKTGILLAFAAVVSLSNYSCKKSSEFNAENNSAVAMSTENCSPINTLVLSDSIGEIHNLSLEFALNYHDSNEYEDLEAFLANTHEYYYNRWGVDYDAEEANQIIRHGNLIKNEGVSAFLNSIDLTMGDEINNLYSQIESLMSSEDFSSDNLCDVLNLIKDVEAQVSVSSHSDNDKMLFYSASSTLRHSLSFWVNYASTHMSLSKNVTLGDVNWGKVAVVAGADMAGAAHGYSKSRKDGKGHLACALSAIKTGSDFSKVASLLYDLIF